MKELWLVAIGALLAVAFRQFLETFRRADGPKRTAPELRLLSIQRKRDALEMRIKAARANHSENSREVTDLVDEVLVLEEEEDRILREIKS